MVSTVNGEILGGKPAISNLIDRTFGDASPNQWLRELVKNGFDADAENILVTAIRPDIPGWDKTGIKVAVVDDGHGMTETDGRVYLGDIFNGKSSLETNFHVGARVSTLPLNHAGVLIASWTENEPDGWMMWLRKDDNGIYICQYFVDEDGIKDTTAAAFPWLKHPIIKDAGHGTVVVLMGHEAEDHTFGMFEMDKRTGCVIFPTARPSKAVFSSHLSTVFWNSPNKSTKVRAVHAGEGQLDTLRTAKGKYLLPSSTVLTVPVVPFGDLIDSDESFGRGGAPMKDKYIQDRGTVVIMDGDTIEANIHWILLNKKAVGSEGKNRASDDLKQYTQFPLFGELHLDELYNFPTGASRGVRARHLLERYGITEADVRSRVAIIVEPLGATVTPSQSRGRLLPGNGENNIPHDEWGHLFRMDMPESLKEALEDTRDTQVFSAALEKATADIDSMVNDQLGCYIKDARSKRRALVSVNDEGGDAATAPLPPGGKNTGTGTPNGTANLPHTQTGRTVVMAPARKAKKAYEPPVISFTSWKSTPEEPDLGTRMVRIEPYGDTYLIDLNRAHPLFRQLVDALAEKKADKDRFKKRLEESVIKEVHAITAAALSMARSSEIGTWTQRLARLADESHEAMLSNLILSPYHMSVRAKSLKMG